MLCPVNLLRIYKDVRIQAVLLDPFPDKFESEIDLFLPCLWLPCVVPLLPFAFFLFFLIDLGSTSLLKPSNFHLIISGSTFPVS